MPDVNSRRSHASRHREGGLQHRCRNPGGQSKNIGRRGESPLCDTSMASAHASPASPYRNRLSTEPSRSGEAQDVRPSNGWCPFAVGGPHYFYQHSASPPTGRDRSRRGCGRAGLPERPPEIWSGNQSARGYTYLAGSAAAIGIWRDAITGLTGIRRRTVAVARLEIAAALAAMPASAAIFPVLSGAALAAGAAILAVTRSGKPRRGGAEFHGNKSARPPTSPVRGARGMGDTLARSR